MNWLIAQLDTTDDKQERLDFIQGAFNSALLRWQRVKERAEVGAEPGGPLSEMQARADAYKLRIMWLNERANAESKPSDLIEQEELDTDIGKGVLPDGIAEVTDIKKLQLLRVEVLKESIEILNDNIRAGTVSLGQLSELYS